MLIASKDCVANLPFDIRHNRVVVYDRGELGSLRDALRAHLSYFAAHFRQDAPPPDLGTYFAVLADNKRDPKLVIQEYVNTVAAEFQLTDAKLIEAKALQGSEGFLIRIQDAFRDEVVFVVDPNGVIRQKRRIQR